MTVAQLIERLKDMPSDAKVVVCCEDGDYAISDRDVQDDGEDRVVIYASLML